jgi:Ca2+-transporting ATPase
MDPVAARTWLPAAVVTEVLGYFMIAVTIIVVAVPEGLAMSLTLSLAYSMRRMIATNNLVRRMHACETVGAATVICCDKTGTLTLNEMTVAAAVFPVLGDESVASEPNEAGYALVAEALACNNQADLSKGDEGLRKAIGGNPTEGALLGWLHDRGTDYMASRSAFEIHEQHEFSTERKYMATRGQSGPLPGTLIHVKGAPELLLEKCTLALKVGGQVPLADLRSEVEEALASFQRRGMRTLGFAFSDRADANEGDIAFRMRDLTWLGFVAITDPVRPEVAESLEACRRAGIDVKIITGDNAITAAEVARQIGLGDSSRESHVSGRDFAAMYDETAALASESLRVLSRARPLDKLRLVQLLQSKGDVVAVTGDGSSEGIWLSSSVTTLIDGAASFFLKA